MLDAEEGRYTPSLPTSANQIIPALFSSQLSNEKPMFEEIGQIVEISQAVMRGDLLCRSSSHGPCLCKNVNKAKLASN
jgi:hypothetical protein